MLVSTSFRSDDDVVTKLLFSRIGLPVRSDGKTQRPTDGLGWYVRREQRISPVFRQIASEFFRTRRGVSVHA